MLTDIDPYDLREFLNYAIHGPTEQDYVALEHTMARINQAGLDLREKEWIWDLAGRVLHSSDTSLAAHIARKPYGYAGDFEVIDRMYTRKPSYEPPIERMNSYINQLPAVLAIRNRKAITKNLMHAINLRVPMPHILSVASGGARDVAEFLEATPNFAGTIVLVDMEVAALDYAKQLIRPVKPRFARVEYRVGNALKWLPPGEFDLIYSAGLADYLSDKVLARLVRRLKERLSDDGILSIGNFGPANPNRDAMELLDWNLIHRDPEDLVRLLALETGDAKMFAEPQGINLFFHHNATGKYRNDAAAYHC